MRIIAVIFGLIFLSINLGSNVYAHFCGDYLAKFNLAIETNTDCCGEESDCKMPKRDKSCCNDVEQFIIFDKNQNYHSFQVKVIEQYALLAKLAIFNNLSIENPVDLNKKIIYKPIQQVKPPNLFKLNCSFIYYG